MRDSEHPRIILLAVLGLLLIVLALFLFLSSRREKVPEEEAEGVPESLLQAPEQKIQGKKNVVLFFLSEERGELLPEEREIEAGGSSVEEAMKTLEELLKGSRKGYVLALPSETKIRQVYITKDGTAYADFSKELVDKHPSGSEAEIATVYSIVNTLAYNFKDIQRVFILVDGSERETLKGHIRLNRAFLPQYPPISPQALD